MNSWQHERVGPVAQLTLTRAPVNALDQQGLEELAAFIENVSADRSVRAVVITGGLPGIFCSGGDLKYWRNIRDGGCVSENGRSVFERLERLEIPTIAAVNGSVVGDGLALGLACDLRIACEASSFRLPELGYGFIPGWGTIRSLVSVVGRAQATNMLLTGRVYDAAKALQIGLVHEVIAADRLREEVMVRARAFASVSVPAVRAAKCALRGGDEQVCFQGVWGSEDWREGIEALLAKRTPIFAQKE